MSHARWQVMQFVSLPPLLFFCEDVQFFFNPKSASCDENKIFACFFTYFYF
jgi:hypothetical protein